MASFPRNPRNPGNCSKSRKLYMFFTAKVTQVTLWCNVVFFTCSYPSHVKHLVLRAFFEDCLPEKLSKLGVLAERGIKRSKKHHAIAQLWPKIWESCSKTSFLEFAPGSRQSRQSPGSRGNDVAAHCSEPPFPTHGGQDDGS